MMINFNQQILPRQSAILLSENRGLKYGDAIFETLKVIDTKVVFAEEHYFRLMASMRMLRMKIPMYFTFEFFTSEILKTVTENKIEKARVRFSVWRKDGGLLLPKDNTINFLIEASQFTYSSKEVYVVDLFKDYYQSSGLLSTIKTNSKLLNVLASIFADENELDNCVLLNEKKHIVEAMNANIFITKGNTVYTPTIEEGCLKGIIRHKVIELLEKEDAYTCVQTQISPFELLKADEVFVTNSIIGIQSVSQYRKKKYSTKLALLLSEKLKVLETSLN